MKFRNHPLLYILVPLCALAIIASFYRFIVVGDYIVEYEGSCDPATESCFFACEDEDCTSVYHHSWVQKKNADVLAQCGPDLTDCEAAGMCLPTDQYCSIRYCDAFVEECVGPNVVIPEEEETGEEQQDL